MACQKADRERERERNSKIVLRNAFRGLLVLLFILLNSTSHGSTQSPLFSPSTSYFLIVSSLQTYRVCAVKPLYMSERCASGSLWRLRLDLTLQHTLFLSTFLYLYLYTICIQVVSEDIASRARSFLTSSWLQRGRWESWARKTPSGWNSE